MYLLCCNNNGFFLQSRYVKGNSLENSGFTLEYDFDMNQMFSVELKYAALGYFKGLPALIYGRYSNFYTLIWLNCTPKEAYEKALALKLMDQQTIQLFLMWRNSIMDPVLETFKELPFVRIINRQSKIIEHATDVIVDYYEQKTGGLIVKSI
jgi:hypothetical protein